MVEATHHIMNKGLEVWQSDFQSNEWYQTGYPMCVLSYLVGQFPLDGEDMLLKRNPEKYWPIEKTPPTETKPLRNEFQGEFILVNQWDNKIKV